MSNIPKLSQQVVEQAAHVLGECGTGDEISRIFECIGVRDDSGESTKWRRINGVLWRAQLRDGNATKFIDFTQHILAPVRFVGRGDAFKSPRSSSSKDTE